MTKSCNTHKSEYESINQLYENKSKSIPACHGQYMVLLPEHMTCIIKGTTDAITEYKHKSMLYDKENLIKKFEKTDKRILYIGETNNLHRRVNQLVKYAYGEVKNHRGGCALWQISNNKELLVSYQVGNEPIKKQLLLEYKEKYGVLPLANRVIG